MSVNHATNRVIKSIAAQRLLPLQPAPDPVGLSSLTNLFCLLNPYRCRKRFPLLSLIITQPILNTNLMSPMSVASLMPASIQMRIQLLISPISAASQMPVSLTQTSILLEGTILLLTYLMSAAPLTPAFLMQFQLLVSIPAASHMPPTVSLTQILLKGTILF